MYEQIKRIEKMEHLLDRCAEALGNLLPALEEYQAMLPQLKELADYYQSPVWMQDHDDDDAGKLPKELKRGVLSEDAVWNLLTDQVRAAELMKALLEAED